MAENEYLDVTNAARWQSVVQAIRDDLAIDEIAELVRDRFYKTLRQICKELPFAELLNAADDPHRLKALADSCEGGLDVKGNLNALQETVSRMKKTGITVSMFIDPEPEQIEASAESGAQFIELHTGCYANARREEAREQELKKLISGAEIAIKNGLRVNAGHGLNYINIVGMYRIPQVEELNIGHSIISRAVFVGLERAVKEMLELLR